jgi:hypothetical protein
MKGRPRDDVDAAVRRAIGDAVFRYILFVRLNLEAHEVADRGQLMAAAVFFYLDSQLGGPRESDLEPDAWAAHQEERQDALRRWRWAAANLRLKVIVEDDARERLEARYFGGRPSVLPDAEAEWDGFADQVERIWSIGEKLELMGHVAGRSDQGDAERILDERVAARAKTIADDARVSAFERLGDMPRAVAIMERRLGTAGDGA